METQPSASTDLESIAVIVAATVSGFEAEYQPICAIAICLMDADREVKPPQAFLIRPPGNKFEEKSIEIHGITPKMTADAPDFKMVWQEKVIPLLEGRVLVAQFADGFHFKVIKDELKRAGIAGPMQEYTCTLLMAQKIFPSLKSYKIEDLADKLDIPLDRDLHDPADRVRAVATLLQKMMEIKQEKSIKKLALKLETPFQIL